MFDNFVVILRRPGALAFSAAGVLARSPQSMAGLAAVLLLAQERGSYSVAGLAVAVYILAGAVVGPQIFRLVDAFGQRRVVPFQLAVHVPAYIGLLAVTLTTTADWPIYLAAAVSGAAQPDAGTMVRARWAALLTHNPLLRTAFAWESLLDDVMLVLGPLVGSYLALRFSPSAALVVSLVLLVVGTMALIAQRSTEPPPAGRRTATHGRPAVLLPGAWIICGIFVLLGGVVGSMEVITVAFTEAAGAPESAGTLLALYAAGSLLAGAVFGAVTVRSPAPVQFVVATLVLAVIMIPLPLLSGVWLLALGLVAAGAARAPTLISATALIERVVPAARLGETMAWSMSGLAVGMAVAAPLAGSVVDRCGAAPGYWVPAGFAVASAVAAAWGLGSLRRVTARRSVRFTVKGAG